MKNLRWLAGFLVVQVGCSMAFGKASKAHPETEKFTTMVLTPFWKAKQLQEPVLFIQETKEKRPCARLLFIPEAITSVVSTDGKTVYSVGTDYVIDKITGTLTLPKGSRISFKTTDEIYPLIGSSKSNIRPYKKGDKKRGILWSERPLYHQLQVNVNYQFKPGQWQGATPVFGGKLLPRTLKKLSKGEALNVLVCGDSISVGGNASKLLRVAPFCPTYPELLVSGLEKKYGSKIDYRNVAVGGWTASRGLKDAKEKELGKDKPDLVVIAFGMNDVGRANPKGYQQAIKGIMEVIRINSPDTEFVLVASMKGNAQWSAFGAGKFWQHRNALKNLLGPGVALADMTEIWTGLLKRKTYYDLTGNGLNHPNDFGHIVYAQVLLALLIEE